ncbi:MAG: acetyl-CoA carboxylase biotin carboxyl carrier protein [Oscillospiraceae bacterium]|nr:acetyl-CoA carboxylase biotin carboxyl carrier protein [Oscillospiraceae bacterium]
MELELVKELAQLMEQKGLSALEVCDGEQKIVLKKELAQAAPQTTACPPPAPQEAPAPVVDFNGMQEVKSPMVGVAYLSSEPGAAPFVKVGDKVKKGQTLCIIEAMKLMNEFTAPQDGEIMDICVQDGQLVEFGQCLFKLF